MCSWMYLEKRAVRALSVQFSAAVNERNISHSNRFRHNLFPHFSNVNGLPTHTGVVWSVFSNGEPGVKKLQLHRIFTLAGGGAVHGVLLICAEYK
jgi:hypothetical protein